jgi:hypothetical protein
MVGVEHRGWRAFHRMIEQGDLPLVRIGRVRKVLLERWMEEHLSSAS